MNSIMYQGINPVIVFVAICSAGGAFARPPNVPPLPDPRRPVNYIDWLAGVHKPPPELDAGPHYERVQRFFPLYGDDDEQLAPFIKAPWNEGSREIESRFIKYEWAMAAFVAATDKPRLYFPLVPFGDFADYIVGMDMAAMRVPSKVLIAQGWRSFAGGDEGPIVDAARRTLVAADHLAQQPLITAQYRAADLSDLAAKTLLRAIHHSKDQSAFVRDHANTVLGFSPPTISAAVGFSGEQLGAYDTIQHSSRWDSQQQRYLIDERGVRRALTLDGWRQPELYEQAIASLSSIDFVATRDAVRDYYQLIYRTLELPYSKLDEAKQSLAQFGSSHTGGPLASTKLFKPDLIVATRRREIEAMFRWHGMRIVWQLYANRGTSGQFVKQLANIEDQTRNAHSFAQEHGFAWSYLSDKGKVKLSLAPVAGGGGKAGSTGPRVFVIWPVD